MNDVTDEMIEAGAKVFSAYFDDPSAALIVREIYDEMHAARPKTLALSNLGPAPDPLEVSDDIGRLILETLARVSWSEPFYCEAHAFPEFRLLSYEDEPADVYRDGLSVWRQTIMGDADE